jgi:predicted  nucleic acid-binding Zn-ribbon protein
MPHQCVRCNTFYEDGSEEILKGCPCGGRLFFYIKKDRLKKAKEVAGQVQLSETEKKQIEKDVIELVGSRTDEDLPIVLDLESIRITKPGKYELDLVHLFKGDPMVVKLEEGKYIIDVPETFKSFAKRKGIKD